MFKILKATKSMNKQTKQKKQFLRGYADLETVNFCTGLMKSFVFQWFFYANVVKKAIILLDVYKKSKFESVLFAPF